MGFAALVLMFLVTRPAAAAKLTEQDVRDMVVDLIPEVEARTGRRFVGAITTGLARRGRVRAEILEPPPQLMPPGMEVDASPTPMARNRAEYQLSRAIALYVPAHEALWVLTGPVLELFSSGAVPPEVMHPVTRCVVMHELVHALQHQYGVQPDHDAPGDLVSGYLALAEGHATRVAMDACRELEGDDVAELVEAIQGTGAPASLQASDPAAPYAWGRILASALEEEDPEVLWAGLAGDPPSWGAIVEAVRPALAPGWDSPEPLHEALAALDMPPVSETVPGPPTRLLGVTAHELGSRSRVDGGWTVYTEVTRDEGRLGVYLMSEPGAAAELLDLRRRVVLAGATHGLVVLAERVGGALSTITVRRVGRVRNRDDVVDTLRVRARNPTSRYSEYWVATDRVLVVMAIDGRRGERDARTVLADLLDTMAPGDDEAPDLAPLQGWLDGVRARAGDPQPITSWQYRELRAARDVAAGSQTACGDHFGSVLDPALQGVEGYALAAFRCAATQDDLVVARRARALLDTLPWQPGTWHAWRLVELGEPVEALEVLAAVDATDDTARTAVADGRLMALIALGRWSEVEDLASRPDASAEMRVFAAASLWNAGRVSEGRALLDEACPEIPEAPTCREPR